MLGASSAVAAGDVGLSSVRAQRFVSEAPRALDHFADALAAGDFDDDGRDELATGVPGGDVFSGGGLRDDAGIVFVRVGAPGGLSDASPFPFSELGASGPTAPLADENFGTAVAACDFDGDTFVDLAVGVPGEDDAGDADSGALMVFHGSAGGLLASSALYLSQESPNVPSISTADEFFGFALACGDFNDDGFDDLAVGVPGQDISVAQNAGQVLVLPGSAGGLGLVDGTGFHQLTTDVPDNPEDFDSFGSTLAVGNFNGDAFADLAVGVPGEDGNAGAVHVFFGGAAGLSTTGTLIFTQASFTGIVEAGDLFGISLATGDFNGDGRSDLAIGAPGEDQVVAGGGLVDAGEVRVLYGNANGSFGGQLWRESELFGAGAILDNELFGRALAAGDFDGDGRDDLAAGAPGERFGGAAGVGMVAAWMGGSFGLTATRVRAFQPGLHGLPGFGAFGGFGFSLASGDFDGDGHEDLAIGAPNETVDGFNFAGSETILYGSLFADGFETGDRSLWSASAP
jgi:hypothetical protein